MKGIIDGVEVRGQILKDLSKRQLVGEVRVKNVSSEGVQIAFQE